MKNWIEKYRRHILFILLCIALIFMIWMVIRREVTSVQFLCWTVMILAGGTITIYSRGNHALHQALLSIFYATFVIEMWTRDQSLVWSLIGAFLVLLMALCAIHTYLKSKRSRCNAESTTETPVGDEGKSNS